MEEQEQEEERKDAKKKERIAYTLATSLLLYAIYEGGKTLAPLVKCASTLYGKSPAVIEFKRSDFNVPSFIPYSDIIHYLELESEDSKQRYATIQCPNQKHLPHSEPCRRCDISQTFQYRPYENQVLAYTNASTLHKREELTKEVLEKQYDHLSVWELLVMKFKKSQETFQENDLAKKTFSSKYIEDILKGENDE